MRIAKGIFIGQFTSLVQTWLDKDGQ